MNEEPIGSEAKRKFEDDIDALFKLPLSEFTGARNNLAAQLKGDKRVDHANFVKALPKPPITAWAVNQLYWKHRNAFDRLLATSQVLRQAQTSHTATNIADMRQSLEARSEALSQLSDLATELLRDGGHNPTPDTIHRITTNLEALSAYATLSDGPTPGRLTQDVDPPGFASLASLIAGTGSTKPRTKLTRVTPPEKPAGGDTKTPKRTSQTVDTQKGRQAEETRRAGIAAAKASLQEAKRSLTEAQRKAQRVEAAQKKANAESKEADAKAKQAEKELRKAEEHFNKSIAASNEAADRAQHIIAEAGEAAQAVEEAKRGIEKASRELESLLRESTAK
jgi:hypothetical protein